VIPNKQLELLQLLREFRDVVETILGLLFSDVTLQFVLRLVVIKIGHDDYVSGRKSQRRGRFFDGLELHEDSLQTMKKFQIVAKGVQVFVDVLTVEIPHCNLVCF
jgi:hypothetical protein